MVRLIELNPQGLKLTIPIWNNLLYHLHCMNEVRFHYKKPMICTNGIRSWNQHVWVYDRLNAQRTRKGLDKISIPTGSSHLIGAGSNWKDPDGDLFRYIANNPALMEKLDLFMESREHTPRHCHLQTVPTKSGNRIFNP